MGTFLCGNRFFPRPKRRKPVGRGRETARDGTTGVPGAQSLHGRGRGGRRSGAARAKARPRDRGKIRKCGRLPLGQLLPRQRRAPRASARADGRREAAARRHMLRAPGAGRLVARREGTAAGAGTATVAQRASGGGHAGAHAAGKYADEDGRMDIEQRFDENLFFKHFFAVFLSDFLLTILT